MKKGFIYPAVISLMLATPSCQENNKLPSQGLIQEMNLKRGEIISCGPADKEFGSLVFDVSGNEKAKEDFTLGLKLLHSFEYDEAEKVFAKIIDEDPACAMAYWGVAMSNFHPLWAPPTEPEIKKGEKALEIANALQKKSAKEAAYIEAVGAFYKDWQKLDHRTRCLAFEKAMENLYIKSPADKEAAIFYALSLTAAADLSDKTFVKQKKAGGILNALYPNEPNHPGIVHYLIHTYDSPQLAEMGLEAARRYASVAPSSAHALHMPSHIFTRLGLWSECIKSNLASVNSAQCYATSAGIKGHWDEELHGLDYLMYAYLQNGDDTKAKQQLDYLYSIKEVSPVNFKVAYAVAAIPSRYVLENKLWNDAANLKVHNESLLPENFPWQKAIIHFTRLMGNVHTNEMAAAKMELNMLKSIHARLTQQRDAYKAGQVDIQIKSGEAWIAMKEGKAEEAIRLMNLAADMEDNTEKSPVTPGEVIPARELLGDMYMEMNKHAEGLQAYEEDLKNQPNRFNGLCGAALSAERSGNKQKAKMYYGQLVSVAPNSNRPEVIKAKQNL